MGPGSARWTIEKFLVSVDAVADPLPVAACRDGPAPPQPVAAKRNQNMSRAHRRAARAELERGPQPPTVCTDTTVTWPAARPPRRCVAMIGWSAVTNWLSPLVLGVLALMNDGAGTGSRTTAAPS